MDFIKSTLFEIGGFGVTVGILGMVLGGLIAIIGVLLAINHSGFGKMIVGVLLAALGLGLVGVGYTFDQMVEVTYKVEEITEVSVRDTNQVYRLTLKNEAGIDTLIYVGQSDLYRFQKGEEVTMTKREVKQMRDQNAALQ